MSETVLIILYFIVLFSMPIGFGICDLMESEKRKMKWFKKNDDAKYGEYPCDVLLNNALRFLAEGKTDAAVSEICFCVSQAGGTIYKENVDLLREKNLLPSFEPRNVR